MSALVVPGRTALKQHLNTEVAVTDYIEVSQERIAQFAALTEDEQWIHTDVERARRDSPYGGTVAHGFLTLSFLSRFLTAAVRVEGDPVACQLRPQYRPLPVSGSRRREDPCPRAIERIHRGSRLRTGNLALDDRVRGESIAILHCGLGCTIFRVGTGARVPHFPDCGYGQNCGASPLLRGARLLWQRNH